MDIRKLTLAPIIKGAPKITISNPTDASAKLLISERLNPTYKEYGKKVHTKMNKLPKELRGFVNPETRVPQQKINYTI